MCKYKKMIPVETIPGIRGGRDKGEWWVEKLNSSKIYLIRHKNLHKCHNVSLPTTTIKGEKEFMSLIHLVLIFVQW
jgi:hypothetical protein